MEKIKSGIKLLDSSSDLKTVQKANKKIQEGVRKCLLILDGMNSFEDESDKMFRGAKDTLSYAADLSSLTVLHLERRIPDEEYIKKANVLISSIGSFEKTKY